MPAVPNGLLRIKSMVLLEQQTLSKVIETVTLWTAFLLRLYFC